MTTYTHMKINLMTGQPAFTLEAGEQFTIIEKPLSYAKVDMSIIN